MMREKLNQVITNENKMNKQSSELHKKVKITQIMTYIQYTRIDFEMVRLQQTQLLNKMIDKSVLTETIKCLNFGLDNN